MTSSLPHRSLIRTLALVVSICALAAALVGASQSLAQTRGKTACTTASARARATRHTGTCATRKLRRAAKRHRKSAHGKRKAQGKSRAGSAPVAASCEDGSAPAPAGEGTFACEDGSEPECENGATPTPTDNGQSLVCPAPSEHQAVGGSEAECEEQEEYPEGHTQEGGCSSETGAQTCEAADASCEGQS